MSAAFVWTKAQRDGLKKLGLFDEQIAQLESILPGVDFHLRKAAPLAEVRSKLAEISVPLANLKKTFEALHKSQLVATVEARNRLESAAYEENRRSKFLLESTAALEQMTRVLDRVARGLPTKQRRDNSANPGSIKLIDDALVEGFARHFRALSRTTNVNQQSLSALRLTADQTEGGPRTFLEKLGFAPAYTIRISRTEPPFPEIVAICFEAVGKQSDPDRAIRGYIALHRKRGKKKSSNMRRTRGTLKI